MSITRTITGALETLDQLRQEHGLAAQLAEDVRVFGECARNEAARPDFSEFILQGLELNRIRAQALLDQSRASIRSDLEKLLGTVGELLDDEDARKVDPAQEDLERCAYYLLNLHERPIDETVTFVRRQLETYRLVLSAS